MVRSGEMADRLAERTPWAALAAALVVTVVPNVAQAQTTGAPATTTTTTTTAPTAATDASIPVATVTPQQQDVVLLEADVLIDDQQARTITAEGNVEARYSERTLRADRLVYDLNTATIHATGNVQIVDANGAEYADEVEVDEDLNRAVATELRARFGPNGALAARSAIRHGPGESELRHVIYTSCPICETGNKPPTWSLRARRAIQDQDSRTISYRDVVFQVAGVPVLYLPFFAHPDPSSGRTSGLMPPDFGRNGRLGTYYDQPYYWAISPYSDMTASARVHSHVHPLYGLTYRKRFWSGAMSFDGTVTNEQEFDSSGHTFGDESIRSSLFGQGRFRVSNYWDWGFGAERISDDLYLRRYDIVGAGKVRGPYVGYGSRLISQLYAIGQSDQSYASVAFVSFQGLLEQDVPALLPLILPYAEYENVLTDPVLHGQVRLQANTAVLDRSVGLDSARLSTTATWRKDAVIGPGIVVSPFAQVRADLYRNEVTADQYETFTRGLGLAGVEISWPFLRTGEDFDFIVEPVVMAAYGTDEDPDPRIVNEDSLGFELDDSSLFRANAAPNYDLWEPGARMSVGVRATARAATGQNASLLFGRRLRSDPAPGFTERNNVEDKASDWVAAVQTDLGRNFASEVRFRLEDESLELERLDAGVRTAFGRFSAGARYFSINEVLAPGNPTKAIGADIGIELARGWRLQASVNRDLDSDINLRQELRAIYEDDCTFLEIAYTRSETLDRSLGPDEGLQIRIGLRSLGVFGGGG